MAVAMEKLEDVVRAASTELGYTLLQLEVISAFLSGHDVFAALPTGFGRSLCLPIVRDKQLKAR